MVLSYVKEIFDPLHGFIKLPQDEVNIVNHLIFQRLHNINQLGALHFVFPTARNTRFSHSLGVLAIISKMIENLKELPSDGSKNIKKFDLEEESQKWIRISALLHDIGHLPFSHCTEKVIEEYIKKKFPALITTKKFHEWLSGQIIKNTDIYNPSGKDPLIVSKERENFSQIINGDSKFTLLNQMLHSELDADRMDYLTRDSYSTGISFGQIDIDQIMRKMFLKKRSASGSQIKDNVIVYSSSGINAIDNFYYSRMFMYNAIYYHKTSCYFDFLISEIYKILINSPNLSLIEEDLPIKPDEILAPILEDRVLNPEEISHFYEQWYSFDDHYLWNCFRKIWIRLNHITEELNDDIKKLKVFLNLLIKRKKSSLIWEMNRLKSVIDPSDDNQRNLDLVIELVFDDLEKWLNSDLQSQLDLPLIVLNHKVDAPLSNLDEDYPIDLNNFEGESIIFYDSELKEFKYLHNVESSINYHNRKSKFHIFRVFYPNIDHDNEIKNAIKKKYTELVSIYLAKME